MNYPEQIYRLSYVCTLTSTFDEFTIIPHPELFVSFLIYLFRINHIYVCERFMLILDVFIMPTLYVINMIIIMLNYMGYLDMM